MRDPDPDDEAMPPSNGQRLREFFHKVANELDGWNCPRWLNSFRHLAVLVMNSDIDKYEP